MILVEAGRFKAAGEIPRYWWPAITGIIVAASFIYWGGLRILMLPNPFLASRLRPKNRNNDIRRVDSPRDFSKETIGQILFGVNIRVIYEDSLDYYREDDDYSTLGLIDGSRRRILYTVFETRLYFVSDG